MRRGLAFIGLLLAAALPLACGGAEVSPEAAVAEAATKTSGAGSSRVAFEGSVGGGGLPQAFAFTGEGAVDYESRQARLSYDMSEVMPGGGELELLMDWPVMYMRFPEAVASELPEGKSWVKFDLGAVGANLGIDLDQLMQLNQGDPSQVLTYLRGVTEGVEELGEEKVRGVTTTHYRALVDVRKSAEQAAGSLDAETRRALQESVDRLVELTGTKVMPMDVWIDEEGLARRISMSFDMNVPEATEKMRMEMSMEFFDFGTAVDVNPPPADEVLDLNELVGSGA
jgi:hypothetical protein